MAKQNEVALQVGKTSSVKTIEDMVRSSVKTLGEALPSHMNAERLCRIALTTLRLNPELYKCTPESFLGALFQSAQLGLEPNIEGQAYIIPFNNNRKIDGKWITKKEAQFQIGYKGYVDLFYRHQAAVSLDMQKVHAEDSFDYQYGTESFIKHKPVNKDRGEVVGYYAIAKLSHGAMPFKYMPKDECLEHARKHSKCWVDKKWDNEKNRMVPCDPHFNKSTPWATNPNAMCLKTVLIQLMKLLPKSIEVQKALSADESIKTSVASDMFGVQDEITYDPAEEGEVVDPAEKSSPEGSSAQADTTQEQSPELDNPADQGPPSDQTQPVCSKCDSVVSEKVSKFSQDKFNAVLCYDCQKAG